MGIEPWAAWALGIIGTVLSGLVLKFMSVAVKRWKRKDREDLLYHKKIDCVIEAWRAMDCDIGRRFNAKFQEKLQDFFKEDEYINNSLS